MRPPSGTSTGTKIILGTRMQYNNTTQQYSIVLLYSGLFCYAALRGGECVALKSRADLNAISCTPAGNLQTTGNAVRLTKTT